MVPGTVERDAFTSREQWHDWWRITAPPAACALHQVNSGSWWTRCRSLRWRVQARPPGARARWGWVRPPAGREALTGS